MAGFMCLSLSTEQSWVSKFLKEILQIYKITFLGFIWKENCTLVYMSSIFRTNGTSNNMSQDISCLPSKFFIVHQFTFCTTDGVLMLAFRGLYISRNLKSISLPIMAFRGRALRQQELQLNINTNNVFCQLAISDIQIAITVLSELQFQYQYRLKYSLLAISIP